MSPSESLVVTLHMDDQSEEHFTALRNAHFPPEINYLPAHISLFHNLPAAKIANYLADVERCANGAIPVNVTGVRFLGRGVAYKLESSELSALRKCLAAHWQASLSAQDRQSFQPHITVQNKVAPDIARRLHHNLSNSFQPQSITGTGIDFWHYRGGPWDHAAFVPF